MVAHAKILIGLLLDPESIGTFNITSCLQGRTRILKRGVLMDLVMVRSQQLNRHKSTLGKQRVNFKGSLGEVSMPVLANELALNYHEHML